MCMLCIEMAKNKITNKEALRAIGEMLNTSKDKKQIEHLWEVSDNILSSEVPETKVDEELDKNWSDELYKK